QLGIVGELSVEGKGEPLSPFDVGALEGLRVVGVFLTACRVADVADRGGTGVLFHQTLVGALLIEVEDLGDGADVFVGLDQRTPLGTVGAESRGQLPPILNVEKHSWEEARYLAGALGRTQRADFAGIEVVD